MHDRTGTKAGNRKSLVSVAVVCLVVAVAGLTYFAGGRSGGESAACSAATVSAPSAEVFASYERAMKDAMPTEALTDMISGKFIAFRDEVGGVACAIEFLVTTGPDSGELERHGEAVRLIGEGEMSSAEKILTGLRDGYLSDGEGSNEDAAQIAAHLGALYFYSDPVKSLDAYKEATTLNATAGVHWIWLGHLLRWNAQFDMAVITYEQGLEAARGTSDEVLVAQITANLGHTYRRRGQAMRAADYYKQAAEMHRAQGNKAHQADRYADLSEIYAAAIGSNELIEPALAWYTKSVALNEELGRNAQLAVIHGQLGQIYLAAGRTAEAILALSNSVSFSETAGMLEHAADRSGELGLTYWDIGDLEKSAEHVTQSLEFNQQLDRKREQAQQHETLGLIYEEQGDEAATCEHWGKALALYRELGADDQADLYGDFVDQAGCG